MSGSVGPAGRSRTSGEVPGFIFTWSYSPKGLGGILPALRYQRRLKTSWVRGRAAVPTDAGRKEACARMMACEIPSSITSR